ncbi:GTPase-associated protein 1-related protein [Streptomyces sp. NPDC093801]|uniref:GTPase-associated protein 1-related protein n=1 Tax=Streptomyces sp. NPDC093801 TaxID=3155203 RepID=UPI00344F7A85
MSLPQFHYDGGPGFAAVTPGVSGALLRAAEPLLADGPPPGSGVLSLSLLPDGGRLLARSVRTGSGFHAHAVHLPEEAGGALPITAWGSAQWQERTPQDGPPPALDRIPAPGPYDGAAMAEFVAARGPWLAAFFDDVRRTAEEPGAPRIVLVEADGADVARWVMLACGVLPHARGRRLSFTTCARHPLEAPQQLVGALPQDAGAVAGGGRRHRVYEAGRGPAPEAPRGPAALWARTAAAVWSAGRAELFAQVRRLPGEPYGAGPLAALALAAGVPLGSAARAAAAEWAAGHGDAWDGVRLRALAGVLLRPGGEPRGAAEAAASERLLAALDTGARGALAAELEPELRAVLADPEGDPAVPALLLVSATALGADTAGLLPQAARKLAWALFTDPEGAYGEEVRAALAELPALRALVLDRLDSLAAGDPPAGARLFARTALRLGAAEALPHLRMCAPGRPAGDRVVALDALLREAGVSPYAEPLVLRTGMRLVWDEGAPTPVEARLLLATTGAPVHRRAGTWELLARTAVEAPAADPEAPELAAEVLRHFGEELPAELRERLLERADAPAAEARQELPARRSPEADDTGPDRTGPPPQDSDRTGWPPHDPDRTPGPLPGACGTGPGDGPPPQAPHDRPRPGRLARLRGRLTGPGRRGEPPAAAD